MANNNPNSLITMLSSEEKLVRISRQSELFEAGFLKTAIGHAHFPSQIISYTASFVLVKG